MPNNENKKRDQNVGNQLFCIYRVKIQNLYFNARLIRTSKLKCFVDVAKCILSVWFYFSNVRVLNLVHNQKFTI